MGLDILKQYVISLSHKAKHPNGGTLRRNKMTYCNSMPNNEKENEKMKNECREYAEMIRNDVNRLYDGETVDECESLLDYIADALDVEYTLNSSRELVGVRVYVTLGGPNCWIDTRNGEVVCAWGSDKESAWLASEVCEEINSYFEDFLNF